jgi:hypothetical protein
LQGRTRRLVIRRRPAFSNQLIKCRQSLFLYFKGAQLRCPGALKLLLSFYRQMAAHTGAPPACIRIPRCETGCEACSHKSAKSAENIELPYLWLRNDGGTEPDRGHSVSFSWSAYPSRGEGSADHFSEACPANGINPRAKLRYCSIQASLIELAEPSYYSNWPRISSTRPRKRRRRRRCMESAQ